MGRPSKLDRQDVADAALKLVADGGPHALTVAALSKALGAPSGSIYHRYDSREQVLAELWLDVVEGFQAGVVAILDRASDVEGAVEAARFMITWTREHELEARLLLLHRRQDFVAGEWPAPLVERAAALEPQLGAALKSFGKRAFGRADAEVMARLRFALLDAPFGGIKPYVQSRKPPPRVLDELVESVVRAVLGALNTEART